jgi:hypothetical protein
MGTSNCPTVQIQQHDYASRVAERGGYAEIASVEHETTATANSQNCYLHLTENSKKRHYNNVSKHQWNNSLVGVRKGASLVIRMNNNIPRA